MAEEMKGKRKDRPVPCRAVFLPFFLGVNTPARLRAR
jgi:hypothetical protein